MKPRRNTVSYSTKESFRLNVEEYSRFRYGVATTLDTLLCAPFGHRFGWQFDLCNALWKWEGDATRVLVRLPIDREVAEKLAFSEDFWSWLDGDEAEA